MASELKETGVRRCAVAPARVGRQLALQRRLAHASPLGGERARARVAKLVGGLSEGRRELGDLHTAASEQRVVAVDPAVEQQRVGCAELGGATDEQTELRGLVSSRLPPRKAPKSEIDAAISTPHHVYRPPAPSVSELAATANAKRSGRVAACAGTAVRIVY